MVPEVESILERLMQAGWPLFQPCEENGIALVPSKLARSSLVIEPDGYLLRFAEDLGQRPTSPVA
jgi:hypothetical protein